MTKFFQTLEELKTSLPHTFDMIPPGMRELDCQAINFHWGKTESPKTAIVVNGNNLERYIYTPKIALCLSQIKDVTYEFKLLSICPISKYQSLIETRKTFESSLLQKYERDWSFFVDKLQKQDGVFFAPKIAIVSDDDKFQEILYQPIPGECIKEGWFGSCILEVNYKHTVLSEISINEVLADFSEEISA